MKTLLLVDDEDCVRESLADYIRSYEIEVFAVASGKEAIETYKKNRPDYVFLDLGLPDIHGLEVLKQLREIDSTARVYVITGFPPAGYAEKVKQLGAVGFMEKPLYLEEIKRVLQTI